jgi:cyclin C
MNSNSLKATDPVLVLVTCIYLATKIEECPIHIKMVTQEAKTVFQGKLSLYALYIYLY